MFSEYHQGPTASEPPKRHKKGKLGERVRRCFVIVGAAQGQKPASPPWKAVRDGQPKIVDENGTGGTGLRRRDRRGTILSMPLEDHLGDIIAKARRQKGVGVELAARAAKVSPSELLRVENTGSIKEPIDFSDLAALLDLDPIKLGRIAAGWEPPRVDLSRWRELRMVTTISGGLAVNSYVVWDPTSRKACVFDVGFDAHPIARIVSEHELELLWVFITHGHHDHVEALPELLKAFPNAICFPFSGSTPCFPKRDTLELSTLCIRPVPMPGHTDDGITYLVTGWPDDSPAVAFVGDCLFAGSMGKTSSDSSVAREAIRRHILSLPPPTLICPGHGPLTTVGDEKSNNPFF